MWIVTGGAGFIGSNLVRALNARGHDDILVVDDLANGAKVRNLADCAIADFDNNEHLEVGGDCRDLDGLIPQYIVDETSGAEATRVVWVH